MENLPLPSGNRKEKQANRQGSGRQARQWGSGTVGEQAQALSLLISNPPLRIQARRQEQ